MGDFMGFAAGIGMAVLVGTLLCLFFREMGWIKPETLPILGRSASMTLGMGNAYLLTGALIFQVFDGTLTSPAQLGSIFRGAYLQRMFQALFTPDWFRPLSGLFAWMAHGLGSVLFGQYMLSGVLLAWGMMFLSLCILQSALSCVWDEKTARDAAFLAVCLPGALFLFLPGWAPFLFLAVSLGAYGIGKSCGRGHKAKISPVLYSWGMAVCVILSAAVTAGAVFGRWG